MLAGAGGFGLGLLLCRHLSPEEVVGSVIVAGLSLDLGTADGMVRFLGMYRRNLTAAALVLLGGKSSEKESDSPPSSPPSSP